MKKIQEILTGIFIGSLIGVFYTAQLTPYLPLIVIVSVVLFIRLAVEK